MSDADGRPDEITAGASNEAATNFTLGQLSGFLAVQHQQILTQVSQTVSTQIKEFEETLRASNTELAQAVVRESANDSYVFKRKGNKFQFDFNKKIFNKQEQALTALKAKQYEKAKQELEEGTQLIVKRQKVIKLADKSEFGWETVNEYLADDLASDDEDAKRIKKAERSAARKVKERLDLRNKKKPKILLIIPISLKLIPAFFNPFVHHQKFLPAFSEPKTCPIQEPILSMTSVINVANKGIGQNTAKSSNSEFEEDKFIQGKLKRNLKFWREVIKPSDFILNMIQSGYKIPFHTTPDPYYFDNRSSALRRKSFVEFQILELLENGCISEVPDCPEFINPLHVAVQPSGKERLILDLSHLNNFIVKTHVKYENLKTVLQLLKKGDYVFSFDLSLRIFLKNIANIYRFVGSLVTAQSGISISMCYLSGSLLLLKSLLN